MSVLSGTVTSWRSAAPSSQAALLAEPFPPGAAVMDGSGVEVAGICVGTDKPCFVGARVEVTKRGGAGVAVNLSADTLMHEVDVKTSRMKIQIFFIRGFYWEFNTSVGMGKSVKERREFPLCSLRSCSWLVERLRFCLWRGENQHVIAKVVEESISHTDLGEGSAQKVQVMARVCCVGFPPIDDSLPGQRRITAIYIFAHGRGDITCGGNA